MMKHSGANIYEHKGNRLKRLCVLCAFLALYMSTVLWAIPVKDAYACASCKSVVEKKSGKEWGDDDDDLEENATTPRIKRRILSEFTAQKIWIVNLLWEDHLLPAMMLMSEQISAVAMQQMEIIGSFLDAKNQMDAQKQLRIMNTQLHKTFQPSDGVCQFGTTIRSLAASEQKGEHAAFVLSQYGQDRALGQRSSMSAAGPVLDKKTRLENFKEKYCDLNDNMDGLSYLCDNGSGDAGRRNKDIDFARVFDWPWTLNVDFTNAALTEDEEDLFALTRTLYGYDVPIRMPPQTLGNSPNLQINLMQQVYQDVRAIAAKRSVAQNSFNAITALKAEGTPGSREYLLTILQELGLNPLDARELLVADKTKNIPPSYYAQMEVLTKKAYQSPNFYTNLYDTPANVERKGVAMQAINLIQNFDVYKSYLRREANASIILELAVDKLQEEIEGEINNQSRTGRGTTQ